MSMGCTAAAMLVNVTISLNRIVTEANFSVSKCIHCCTLLLPDWIEKTLSDKPPGEKLGRCSHSNSMSLDKTIGYEDEKTEAGTYVCMFLFSVESFHFYILMGCIH